MSQYIKPKKSLGQHFLTDKNIARKITESLCNSQQLPVIEIGPGTGVLSDLLIEQFEQLYLIEIDKEAFSFLQKQYYERNVSILNLDFLAADLDNIVELPACVIGNFPYNISSQIFFKILTYRDNIPEVVCMIQKEVAQRIASPPGNKTYGILSVLLQAWYRIEYLFTVNENVFNPPPKVKSAVIRLTRNETRELGCEPDLFVKVVRAAFNQRRKTLRNSLKALGMNTDNIDACILDKRAERLSVSDFVELTNHLYSKPLH